MAGKHRGSLTDQVWSLQDEAMYLTCRIIDDVLNGRVPALRAQTTFAPGPGVVAFVSAPVRVFELRSAGDGSYLTSNSFVFGTGKLGLAMMAGSLIGNSVANRRARARAMADAQVAFRHQTDGNLFVTNAGFILQDPQGVYPWLHDSITAMEVVGPNTAIMQGQSDRGPLTWQLVSPFSELVFVMWALERHPEHPQLIDGSWLQPGWMDFAHSQGRDPVLRSGVLAQPQQIRLPGQAQLPPN